MEWDIQQLIIALVGGGGLTTLGYKIWQVVKEHRQGKLDVEDTAISRWQQIADKAESDAAKDVADMEKELARLRKELYWYRAQYSRLYVAWAVGPPPGRGDFPPTYTEDQ